MCEGVSVTHSGGDRSFGAIEVRMGDSGRRARWVHTFADAKQSELILLVDSYGTLALAYDRQSASAQVSH